MIAKTEYKNIAWPIRNMPIEFGLTESWSLSIGKKISGRIPTILPVNFNKLSLGEFLQDTGKFDSLMGTLGTNILDNAKKGKNVVNGMIKNALTGISKFLSGDLNDNEENQGNDKQVLLEEQIRTRNSADNISPDDNAKLRGGIKNRMPKMKGVFQGLNNNMKNIVGNTVKGGLKNMFTNLNSNRRSNYYINDSYQREQEERNKMQERIRRQHEEELKKKNS